MSDPDRPDRPRGPRVRDARAEACLRLARSLGTPEGLRAARLAQQTGLLGTGDTRPGEGIEGRPGAADDGGGDPGSPGAGGRPSPAGPRPISIWRPRREGRGISWVRPEPSPLGDQHARQRVLHPRQGPLPRRVCVLGESVAAGYLYAPHLTAARALEAWLRELTGGGESPAYEVIDLARTNETLGGLATTAEAALQLEPDLLVLFAGNNWNLLETPEVSPYAPSVAARQEYAEALAQAGPAGPVGLARRRLDGGARAALDRIAAAARHGGARRVDVVVVLPEVNLADWESRQPPPWLPKDGSARWHELFARAAAGDLETVEATAWEMNRLDGSSSPVPFRLLARTWAAQGREGEARDAALAEVDAVHYPLLCSLDAPRATSAARELLADAARRHGWTAVDLRPVFAEATGSTLPGRRLLLDYCHLTAEGMSVATAPVAAEVVRLRPVPAGPGEPAGDELARRPPPFRLSPEVEARARIGAALHGAHRHLPAVPGVGAELLEHWCAAALETSPAAAGVLRDLALVRTAPVPALLAEAFPRLHRPPWALELQHGLRWDGLDGEVLRASAAVLRRAGRPEADEVEAALSRLIPAPGRSLELADGARFLEEPLARFFPEAMETTDLPGRGALRAPWPETGFWLPAAGGEPAALRLAARLPPVPGVESARRGAVAVLVNGREAGRVVLGERWARAGLRVPAGVLRPGLNRLTLRWPPPPPVGGEALEGARRRLELGAEADLHPVFGEVWSFRAALRPRSRRVG